jgi:dihydrofolate synthase / folylpolyglutamate synthase
VPIDPPLSNSLNDWLEYIDSINPKTISLGLDRVKKIKDLCNLNPDFPLIIVAGTNGKGSCCKFLESILYQAGFNVGCYTSPHLFNFNERISINKKLLSSDLIVDSIKYIDDSRENILLTYFEITTLAAMDLMIKENVDIAILEVGLGGRHDAVNVFEPEISLITSISLDHQDYLGDTVEKIGYEKAGVFRKNKHAIINFDNPPSSVLGYANDISANVSIIDTDYKINCKHENFDYIGTDRSEVELPYPSIQGLHQLRNIAGVLRCIELLKINFDIKKEAIVNGLLECNLRGRLEILSQNPFVVVDVAHNPEAALCLYNFISKYKNKGRVCAVFSILEDKSIKDIVGLFINLVDEWHISKINSKRAMPTTKIINAIRSCKRDAIIYNSDNLQEAYMNAYEKSSLNDNIIVFGSFYTVSECLIQLIPNG